MIYRYQCQVCLHEQEVWHKMDEKNNEPCKKCGALPSKMKKIMNWHPTHKRHGSWSRWNV